MMQNYIKRTGEVHKGFLQGTLIQSSVSNSLVENFSTARTLQGITRFFVERA